MWKLTNGEIKEIQQVLNEEIEQCKDKEVTDKYSLIVTKLEVMKENEELDKINEVQVIDDDKSLDGGVQFQLVKFERLAKNIKTMEDELKEAILKGMEEKNIIKIENDDLVLSYVAPTYSERFDSKALKADNKEIYNRYIKLSPVKASIRIKCK